MGNCVNCFYQGDRNANEKGECHVFCLIKGDWLSETATCKQYREYADLGKDIRNRFAAEIRQEEFENRRLKKILRSSWRQMLLTLLISFGLFIAAVKFFDKFIF